MSDAVSSPANASSAYAFVNDQCSSARGERVEKNVGGIDRLGRIVVGAALALAGIAALAGYWAVGVAIGVLALAIGVILLATGTTRKCPVNEAAGIDTTE